MPVGARKYITAISSHADNAPSRRLERARLGLRLEIEGWSLGLLGHCVTALKAILLGMADLNKLGGCCSSFPVFTKSRFHKRLSTVDVRFEEIENLADMLTQLLNWQRSETLSFAYDEAVSKIRRLILGMLERFLGSKIDAVKFGKTTKRWSIGSYVLHMTALCAQMFSIGLVTFCGGHCSNFDMPQISRTVEKFYLQGTGSVRPRIIVEKVELTCLGEFVQRPVWAFIFDPNLDEGAVVRVTNGLGMIHRIRHDIEAKISQLVDIWDTTIIVDDQRTPGCVKLRMGSGFLCKATRPLFARDWSDTMLHWSAVDEGMGLPISYLEDNVKVIVGAVTENETCLLSRDDCVRELAGSLVDLRTQAGHWKPHSRTTGGHGWS